MFEHLIAIGKDAQQRAADEDARRRPGVVIHRTKDRSATPARIGARANEHVYDLDRELRPALGRIGEKIARLLVAIRTPLSASDLRSQLSRTLGPLGVRSERTELLAAAIADFSTAAQAR